MVKYGWLLSVSKGIMNTVLYKGEHISPSKIICIGRNYAAHVHELGNEIPDEMVVFLKPNSAITSQLQAHQGEPLHFETELVFMVKGGKFEALAVGLDLTKRALQNDLKAKGLPWERSKAFDGAALFSEFVPVPSDLNGLSLALDVNGEPRQRGHIGQMLFSPELMLTNIKQFMTLADGDLIMTGTPEGVGKIVANEVFDARILNGNNTLVSNTWQAKWVSTRLNINLMNDVSRYQPTVVSRNLLIV